MRKVRKIYVFCSRRRRLIEVALFAFLITFASAAAVFLLLVYNTATSQDPVLNDTMFRPMSLSSVRTLDEPPAGPQVSTALIAQKSTGAREESFFDKIHRLAKPADNPIIIIAYSDSSFADMAINFYRLSIAAHDITNFLFIASDHHCCDILRTTLDEVECHVQREDQSALEPGKYGDIDFIRKMNFRTDAILAVLGSGISLLHSDTDVVFVHDPMPYILGTCFKTTFGCDMAFLLDKPGTYNAGFVFVRPTDAGIGIYRRMKEISFQQPMMDDQMQMNNAVIERRNADSSFNAITLPTDLFASGKVYFEDGQRTFAGDNPCAECIVIHNNWIVSKAAKILRFREQLMWSHDDGYYCDPTARYIEYDNPFVFRTPLITWWSERMALRSALAIGQILGRIVILPRFHCPEGTYTAYCSLNSYYRVSSFDAAFIGQYREYVFLRNDRVPMSVRESRSGLYRIRSALTLPGLLPNDVTELVPMDAAHGATSDEIIHWFGDITDSVLRFHSLYRAFGSFTDKDQHSSFEHVLQNALISAEYRQY